MNFFYFDKQMFNIFCRAKSCYITSKKNLNPPEEKKDTTIRIGFEKKVKIHIERNILRPNKYGYLTLPCNLFITGDTIYDSVKYDNIADSFDCGNKWCQERIYAFEDKIRRLAKYIRKLEKKYNNLPGVVPIKPYQYDDYQDCELFKFNDKNERRLFYVLLCLFIKNGYKIIHNKVIVSKTGIKYNSDDDCIDKEYANEQCVNDELGKFYNSKKGKWFTIANVYETLEEEQLKEKLTHWRSDISIRLTKK